MEKLRSVGLILGATVLTFGAPLQAAKLCRPAITINHQQLGKPINLRRVWMAEVSIDASACATDSGLFSLRIMRAAENAPDLEFVEPLLWRIRQQHVTLEFWIDEAVQSAEVAEVADCPCRER